MRVCLILFISCLFIHKTVNASNFTPLDPEFTIEANIIPSASNDDIPNTTPTADVDDGAYLFGATVQWPADTNPFPGMVKSIENYYQLFFAKGVLDVEDDYVESVTEIAFIYGKKYYLQSAERRGLALGWYAGFSLWDADGYDYDGNIRYAGYSESGTSALIAGEIRYDYRVRIGQDQDFLVYPSLGFTFDKDFEELRLIPRIMIGVVF